MPKNAVQRLQKIDSDLKTVIHIYDIADKYKNEQERPEAPENEITRQSSLHDSFKKISNFDTECSQGVFFRKSRLMIKKPESAPSSSSALFTICESDYIGQPSSEFIHDADQRGILTRKNTLENLKDLNSEFDLNYASIHELLMSPSKTLQAANEILAENKYAEETEVESDCEPRFYETIPYYEVENREDDSKLKNQDAERKVNNSQPLKHNSEFSFIQLREEWENENVITEKNRTVPSRKENPVQKEFQDWPFSAVFKSIGKVKHSTDSKKDKSSLEISQKRNMMAKKIPRLESRKFDITEEKNNAKLRGEIENSQEKTNTFGNCRVEKENPLVKRVMGDANANKYLKEVKSKALGKNSLKEKKVKFLQDSSDCNNQKKICKTAVPEDLELWVKDLSKIIEISNEKLEKMKYSKEIALNIAKYLKNKYDEMLESKEKLMENIQKLEEENEKLKREIKEVQQSRTKLQLTIEGLKRDSRTKLTEQNTKVKSALEENIYLKNKIFEIESQFTEELFKKQKEIDQIQRERFDIRKELINRENREEDVQRLKNEKSELQLRLNNGCSKITILEEKILQLQEENQKQKQHLKKKTERLEETNKELESIRQTSKDLEEQVKTLRKNIENFDEIQKNLMKQTAAYDEQIKSNQEVIKKFQNENSNLIIELENEKDALLIKTKIIEDQQETIQKLREKSEEAKALVKKNQSLEKILNTEREEKLELQEAVEHLKWRKEELKKKINSLENEFVLAPQEVVDDLKKTQVVLHELENQVQIKQKEWELQLQSVLREKEQACSVAEFATKKLMQITNEFQKQSQAHKRLQIILAQNLAEKEKNQQESNEQVILAKSKQSLACPCLDDQITNCLKGRHQNSNDILMNWYFKNTSSCHEASELKSNQYFS